MSDILIAHDPEREQECAGHNSWHPMNADPFDPFDIIIKIAVVVAALCLVGMMVKHFWP